VADFADEVAVPLEQGSGPGVDEHVHHLHAGDRLSAIGEVIAVGQRQNHQLGVRPGRLAGGCFRDRGARIACRQRRGQVQREVGVQGAEHRDRAVGRGLAGEVAADNPHAAQILFEPLVETLGQQGVALHVPDDERAVPDHRVDHLIGGAQVSGRRAGSRQRRRAALRVREGRDRQERGGDDQPSSRNGKGSAHELPPITVSETASLRPRL
jgi:hypothetical protein